MNTRSRSILAVLLLPILACSDDGGTGPGDDEPSVETITVTSASGSSSLLVGETLQLQAVATDQQGNPVQVSSFTWSSSNQAVAQVTASGLVTAAGGGQATITAAASGEQGSLQITVSGSLHSVDVTSDQTWRAADNPHFVTTSIRVQGSGSPVLTIEPGVEVRMASGATLLVGEGGGGSIRALGTAASPIRFEADASTPQPGFWRDIVFSTASSGSELHHTSLSHCGAGPDATCVNAIFGATPVLDHVTVQNSSSGGFAFEDDAAFAPGSAAPSVTGAASHPIVIDANLAGTIPAGGAFTSNGNNTVRLVSDQVDRTQTWANLGIPYVVSGRIDVGGSGTVTLTIPAGTVLRFAAGESMLVGQGGDGALVAQGTAAAPVRFTADAGSPTPGYWRSIDFRGPAASASRIQNAIFEFCGAGPNATCLDFADQAKPVLENVTVQSSSTHGLVFDDGSAFGSGSANVSVSGAGRHPIVISANQASTIPSGTFTGSAPDAILLVSDQVDRTQTWPNRGIPYVISGRVDIGGSGTPVLTIPAGTEVRFAGGESILVGQGGAGSLLVQGTAAAPVRFTGDAASPTPGFWRAITFFDDAGGSRIEHAIIEFGGGGTADGSVEVYREFGGFITNSTFRNSATCGIWVDFDVTTNFTAAALNNTFTGNAGGAQCQ